VLCGEIRRSRCAGIKIALPDFRRRFFGCGQSRHSSLVTSSSAFQFFPLSAFLLNPSTSLNAWDVAMLYVL
jgi:hypothetical protein